MLAPLALALLTLAAPISELALAGHDPVRLGAGEEVLGRRELEATWGRYTYRFSDEASRETFLAAPELYGIQWGGGCARMGPLSGRGSPERWAVHGRRIYIFASDACRDGFLSAPERYVALRAVHPPLDPVRLEAGAQAVSRAVEAHGGTSALDAPAALRLVSERESSAWTHRLEHLISRAGELRRRSTWTPPDEGSEARDSLWVLAASSFAVEDGQRLPVSSPAQLDDLRRFVLREPMALLRLRKARGFVALALGKSQLDGAQVEDVLVLHAGLQTTLHLDPLSGRVRALSWRGRVQDGQTRQVIEHFDGLREVAGVSFPSGRRVLVDGESVPSLAPAWGSLEVLPEVPEGSFSARSR